MNRTNRVAALLCAAGLTLAVFCQGQEQGPSAASAAGNESAASVFESSEQPGGGGQPGYIPIWVTPYILSNSIIFQSGGKVGIGTTNPATKLDVAGGAWIRGPLSVVGNASVSGSLSARLVSALGGFFTGATLLPNTAIVSVFQNGYTYTLPPPTQLPPAAIVGQTTATSGLAVGVVGINSTPIGMAVVGYNSATTGGNGAVAGFTNTAEDGAGIDGEAWSPSGNTQGVKGQVWSPDGIAGHFINHNGGTALKADGPDGTVFSVDSVNGTTVSNALNVQGSSAGQIVSVSQGGSGNGIAASTAASGSSTAIKAAIVGTTTGSYAAGVAGISTGNFTSGVYGQASGPQTAAGMFINTGGGDLIDAGTSLTGCASHCTFTLSSGGHINTAGNGVFGGILVAEGTGTSGVAGNFNVGGTLTKGSGSFKIDHPLDPANKYLSHSFVESPDMMNIYNGNVVTDEKGEAEVVLPDYFQALNRDFRYQLTVIGQFAQAIVGTKINNSRFTIRTDKPGVEVSWQVTGIRQDAWANAHRIAVEEDKPAAERGYYLHPELFGAPKERSIEASRSALQEKVLAASSNTVTPVGESQ